MLFDDKSISEVMTPLPITVEPSTSLQTASHLMRRYDIRHLPVVESDKLVGLAIERDVEILLRLNLVDGQTEPVRTVMSKVPLAVSTEAKVSEVTQEMVRTKIDCALVLKNHKVVGIFTLVDVLSLLLSSDKK